MAGDLVRYLVAFQNVLEAGDFDPETFHGAQENQNLVLSVGVAMNESLTPHDLEDRIQFQIPWDRGCFALFSFFETGSVLTGCGETVFMVRGGGRAWLGYLPQLERGYGV